MIFVKRLSSQEKITASVSSVMLQSCKTLQIRTSSSFFFCQKPAGGKGKRGAKTSLLKTRVRSFSLRPELLLLLPPPLAPCFLELRGSGGAIFHGIARRRRGAAATGFGPQVCSVTVKPWEQNCKTLAWTHY